MSMVPCPNALSVNCHYACGACARRLEGERTSNDVYKNMPGSLTNGRDLGRAKRGKHDQADAFLKSILDNNELLLRQLASHSQNHNAHNT